MPVEIERKFLVRDASWRTAAIGTAYRQGYLLADGLRSVRVRQAGDRGYLTIKGARAGMVRPEYEYEIPLGDAIELLATLCTGPIIEKTRYRIDYAGHLWEVDEFAGDNQGLIVAEIELADPAEDFARPPWLGEEVTQDRRYYNSQLTVNPYNSWPKRDKD